jgi:hypothetical protein
MFKVSLNSCMALSGVTLSSFTHIQPLPISILYIGRTLAEGSH